MTMCSPKIQTGFSLTDFMIWTVVASIGLAGLYSMFGRGSTAAQATQLGAELTTLLTSVKTAYAGNYANATNANLSATTQFQGFTTLIDNAGVVTVAVGGGTLTVSGGTATSANDSVQYVVTQLPDAACKTLAIILGKTATVLKFGSDKVKDVGTSFDATQIKCSGDNNTMTFLVI